MHRLIPFLFFFSCLVSFGQNSLLNTAFTWFGKVDRTSIDTYLKSNSYQFIGEKDSIPFHIVNYSLVKTENGTQPVVTALLSDTALEFISLDTYGHRTDIPVLKNGRFKSIGTKINGNFITTTYDNGTFLIHEDYEAVGNPLGKGEIAYFRYRIFRKYGTFDEMNGEKIRFSVDGDKISENYKNGLLDGQRTIYFPDGTVKRTENYRAGRLNGIASDYNREGKLIHSSTHSYHWKYGMEKWYNNEGKVVKTLQWQRDIPVGTEKQTFNGTTIGSISYVKGVKQGMAKVPIYYDDYIQAKYPRDTLNDKPFAIESVNFDKGLKSGKAVCTHFNSTDTMYVRYYKSGQLDSTFTRYGQKGALYTTTYLNGLEHGTRIYRIPSGPLKDSVHRIENYKNGKLDGILTQYYRKEADQTIEDPDPHIRLSGDGSIYPMFIPGPWLPHYYSFTYRDGLKNGPYSYQMDSMNYGRGTYLNDRLEGYYETQVFSDGQPGKLIDQVLAIPEKKWIKTSGNYQNGLKTGTWTTNNLLDSIVVTEQFENNRKHGSFSKTVKGFLTEERFYETDTLETIVFFKAKGYNQIFNLKIDAETNILWLIQTTKKGNETSRYTYQFGSMAYSKIDTLITSLRNFMEEGIPMMPEHLNGEYRITTPFYEKYGSYRNGKDTAVLTIQHFQAEVFEKTNYQNQSAPFYTNFEYQPYSGVFISVISGEKISVKNGLRHGWCIEFLSEGKTRRTKYAKGIIKKQVISK